ncbi:arylsulfatase [Atlantibacter hermannii]|nr:arylsulfatase [Atlantibacter hermannii]
MKKAFHLMAKPVSYQCNIACDYCFYLEKEQGTLKPKKPARHMDDDTLRRYVKQYIEANPAQEVEFTWQGGEPTLAGCVFMKPRWPCRNSTRRKNHSQQYADQRCPD